MTGLDSSLLHCGQAVLTPCGGSCGEIVTWRLIQGQQVLGVRLADGRRVEVPAAHCGVVASVPVQAVQAQGSAA